MRQGLGTSESGVGRKDGTSRGENLAIAFKHSERCVLVCEPAQCSKRHKSVGADHNQTAKAMSDTRKAEVSAISTDAVVQKKVTAIHTDLDAVAGEGDDARAGHQ
ncbi:MAG TPA: hypothetical protein VEI01_12060 [Terriglobales bacterium]|nr:hypothetical protein [Terriglobales bacterium]